MTTATAAATTELADSRASTGASTSADDAGDAATTPPRYSAHHHHNQAPPGTRSHTCTEWHSLPFAELDPGAPCLPCPQPRQSGRWRDFCACQRSASASAPEDPFDAPPCWWFPRVIVCGADTDYLVAHSPAAIEELAERHDWQLPPPGLTHHWTPSPIVKAHARIRKRFNFVTLTRKLGVTWVMKRLRKMSSLLFLFIAMWLVFVSAAFVIVLFGVVPIGDMRACTFADNAVFALFTIPLMECVMTLAYTSMLFASLDFYNPWRPLAHYAIIFVAVYLVEAVFATAIFSTLGPFAFFGAVTRVLGATTTWLSLELLRRRLLLYDVDSDTIKWHAAVPDVAAERWAAFRVVFIAHTFFHLFFMVYAYLQQTQRQLSDVWALTLSVMQLAGRKVVQHVTHPFHHEMTFVLAGFWIYHLAQSFAIWSTPNFDVDESHSSISTYLLLGVPAITEGLAAVFKQSQLWFRFRCWIKKSFRSIFCPGVQLDPEGVPIYVDMDFDGRGYSNAHPDYKRSKVFFSTYSLLAVIVAYLAYMPVSAVLRDGINRQRFPFEEPTPPPPTPPTPPTTTFDGATLEPTPEPTVDPDRISYSDTDYYWTLLYASLISFVLAVSVRLYEVALRRWHPQSSVVLREHLANFFRYSHKSGMLVALTTANLCVAVAAYCENYRIYTASAFVNDGRICPFNTTGEEQSF